MTALLELCNVSRSYPSGEEQVAVLKDISLQIHAGEMVAIVGVSGSGKSTLMNILGCLDKPTSGTYRVAGRDVSTLTRTRWRSCGVSILALSFSATICCRI